MTIEAMETQEVLGLAAQLDAQAQQLTQILNTINRLHERIPAIWDGHDAEMALQWWTQQHRPKFVGARDAIAGFAQSIKNNAAEQSQASAGTAGGPGISSGAPVAPQPSPMGASRLVNGHPGWGHPLTDDEARAIADQFVPAGERSRFDFSGGGGRGDQWYQCTAWAVARWRQMGYTGEDWRGDGGAVAHNINQMLGRPDAHEPTVGAIVSRPGHVAVVEEVRTLPNGQVQFRVSEMNMDGNINVARPNEFQISNWITTDPARHTFAPFPG